MKSVENRVVGYKILGKFYNWNNSTTERDGQNLFHSEASAHSFDINISHFVKNYPNQLKSPYYRRGIHLHLAKMSFLQRA